MNFGIIEKGVGCDGAVQEDRRVDRRVLGIIPGQTRGRQHIVHEKTQMMGNSFGESPKSLERGIQSLIVGNESVVNPDDDSGKTEPHGGDGGDFRFARIVDNQPITRALGIPIRHFPKKVKRLPQFFLDNIHVHPPKRFDGFILLENEEGNKRENESMMRVYLVWFRYVSPEVANNSFDVTDFKKN